MHLGVILPNYGEGSSLRRTAVAFLEGGADGVVVSFPDESSMRELVRRYR